MNLSNGWPITESANASICEILAMKYSKGDLKRAGRMLSGVIPDDPTLRDEQYKTFKIAYAWRASHIKAMSRIRTSLSGNLKGQGFTSARLKRMSSIRRKLSKTTIKLHQMQDLGGCRAVLDDIDGVRRIVESYRNSKYSIRQDVSYIDKPSKSGYRSHHFIFDVKSDDIHSRRIEMQLRTRLQHSWATAVEAVGMVRKEELKSGEGDTGWLRLFSLMSCLFAEYEGCQKVPRTPVKPKVRNEEIMSLAKSLNAVKVMKRMSTAFDAAKDMIGKQDASCFLIHYNASTQKTSVESYGRYSSGAPTYFNMESSQDVNTVLVEVDRLKNLLSAYPNYFLDVREFVKRLEAVR